MAFSTDGGRQWGPPRALHEGRPLGRVDVAFLPGANADAVVSFLEQARPLAETAGGDDTAA